MNGILTFEIEDAREVRLIYRLLLSTSALSRITTSLPAYLTLSLSPHELGGGAGRGAYRKGSR